MSKYAPGTINTPATAARRRRERNRAVDLCTRPTGSQVFSTTEKVRKLQGRDDVLEPRVTKLETKATQAEADIASVREAIEQIDTSKTEVPVGGVIFMSSKAPPSASGYPGTWRFLFEWALPQGALFLFERVKEVTDDNDS